MIKKQNNILSNTILKNCIIITLFLFFIIIFTKPVFAYGEDVLEEDKKVMLSMERVKYFNSIFKYTDIDFEVTYNDYVLARKIYKKVMNSKKSVEKIKLSDEATLDRVITILSYEHFYYEPLFINNIDEEKNYIVAYFNVNSIKKSKKTNDKIENRIKEIIQECNFNTNMTVYEAIDVLDDWFIKNVKYDYTYNALSIKDPLFKGKAICATYSEAFQEICNYIGIEAHLAVGREINHEWNIIKINNHEYMIDTCWDACTNSKQYFLTTQDQMLESHGGVVDITNKNREKIKNAYKINYVIDNGTHKNVDGFIHDENISFKKAKKLGYNFWGWYKEPSFLTKINNTTDLLLESETLLNNVNIYAKWEPIKKEKTYKINGSKINIKLNKDIISINPTKIKSKNTKIYLVYKNKNNTSKIIKKEISKSFKLKDINNKPNIKLKIYNKNKLIKKIDLRKDLI